MERYRERSERRNRPNLEKGSIAGKHHLKGNGWESQSVRRK